MSAMLVVEALANGLLLVLLVLCYRSLRDAEIRVRVLSVKHGLAAARERELARCIYYSHEVGVESPMVVGLVERCVEEDRWPISPRWKRRHDV